MARHPSLGVLLAIAGAGDLTGQTLLFSIPAGLNDYRRAIAMLGDVDHDGHPDIVVGGPGSGFGEIIVNSGADGAPLYGVAPQEIAFGASVASAGDVNADGTEDLIVGAPGQIFSYGSALVLSGSTGATLYRVTTIYAANYYGSAVAGIGDMNADGFDDFAVGSATAFPAIPRADVFSGADGSLLRNFGAADSIAGGDFDADGFADIATSSWQGTSRAVRVASGRTFALIRVIQGVDWVTTGGDVDADGSDDLITSRASAPNAGGTNNGVVRVYSGASGSLLREHFGSPGSYLGYRIAAAGDVDGDGFADYAASAGDTSPACSVTVYSGATGAPIHTFTGGAHFGESLGGGRDLDGDGYDDIIVGGPGLPTDAYTLGAAGTPGRERILGAGCRCSNGHMPRIGFRGSVDIGTTLTVSLRGARAASATVLHFGNATDVALDVIGLTGCSLYSIPFVALGANLSADGFASYALALPLDVPAIGNAFQLQWALLNAGADPLGVVLSNALELTIGS